MIAGTTMNVPSGATLNFAGTSSLGRVTLRSGTPGTYWNLANVAGSTVTAVYVDVQDSNASNAVNATRSVNNGHNVNWNFGNSVIWISDTAKNWSDDTAWSTGTVPNASSDVIFPYNHVGDCTLTASVIVNSIASASTGTLFTSANNYNITTGDLLWNAGNLSVGSSQVNASGNVDFTGGTFTCGTSVFRLNATSAGKTFKTNNQTFNYVTIDGVGGEWTMIGDLVLARNLSINNGTFNTGGANITVNDDFTRTGGTFNNTGVITFSGSGYSSTVDLGAELGGAVVINKSGWMINMTVASGTTIHLGADPVTPSLGQASNFTNNGIIVVDSGTWTLNGSGNNTPTFTNNGTITHSGTGWVIQDCNIVNNNIITHTGNVWDMNDPCSLTNNPGATITYAGTSITINNSFTQQGTFDLTGKTVTFDGDGSATITANGDLGGTVVINKPGWALQTTVANGTTIHLGANPTTTLAQAGGLTNNGAIVVDSGTWTINANNNSASIINNGTITHSGNGWDSNISNTITNNSGGIITYAGTNMTVAAGFIQNGTFDLTGKTVTFDSNFSASVGGVFSGNVTVNKGASTYDFILGADTTIGGEFILTRGEMFGGIYNFYVSGNADFSAIGGGSFTPETSTVILNGTGAQTLNSGAQSYNNLTVTNASTAGVTFTGSCTVTGTFTDITPSSRLKFNAASTYAFANLTLNGQAAGTKVTLLSTTPSSAWLLNVSGAKSVDFVAAADSNAAGTVGGITANNSADGGGNTNWDFGTAASDRYWIASSSANWNNTANWSKISGGVGGAAVPAAGDSVYFDAQGVGSCSLNAAVNVAGITIQAGYTGTITQANTVVTGTGGFKQTGGTFNCAGQAVTIGAGTTGNAGFTLSGGVFSGSSSTITAYNIANLSGGTFTAGSSTLKLTGQGATLTPGSQTFNNLEGGINWGWGLTISGTAVVNGNFIQSSSGFSSGEADVYGDYIIAASASSGSGIVRFMGGANQAINYTANGIGAHIRVDKTGGTLTLANDIRLSGFTYSQGTTSGFDTHKLTFYNTGGNSFVPGSLVFGDVEIGLGSNSVGFTLTGTANVSGNLVLTQGVFAGGTYSVAGDVTLAATASGGGSSAITLNGTGAQNYTLTPGCLPTSGILTVSKTLGVATVSGTGSIRGGINITNGTLEFAPGTYTFNAGTTVTVATGKTLKFSGTGSTLVTLRSGTPGSYWNLANAAGSIVTAEYVDVQDSNATTMVNALDSLNSGHNVNWNIVAPTQVSSWDLNMNTGVLKLVFNNAVSAATLDPTVITIQHAATSEAGKVYTLTGKESSTGTDGTEIEITLNAADVEALKANQYIAKAQSDSYIRFTGDLIDNTYGRSVLGRADGAALQVANYTADNVVPTLIDWTLNMNTYKLAMNFNEPVNVLTLDPTKFTLQNTADAPTATYTLTNSTTASINGASIIVDLSATDFNAIVGVPGLCKQSDRSDSYLTLADAAIKDMAAIGNGIAAITSGVQTTTYTPNTVAATKFYITTAGGAHVLTVNAGTTMVGVIVRAYDDNGYGTPVYAGDKILVFSGAVASPDGNNPIALNKDTTYINFGENTVLNFIAGRATTNLRLYCKTSMGFPAQVGAAEGTSVTTDPNYDLSVTVDPEVKTKVVYSQQPSASGTINAPLAQQPKVSIRDTYGNQTADADAITLYDSSSGTGYADAPGNLTADNNPVTAINGEATFVNLRYDTVGTIYLQARGTGLTSAFSDSVFFSSAGTSTVEVADTPVTNFNLVPINDTLAERFSVLSFKVKDAGGDATPTLIDQVKIAIGGTGSNAATDIAWAGLYKTGVTDPIAIVTTGPGITNTQIIFGVDPNSNSVAAIDSVADNTLTEYTVRVYMKNSRLTDTEGMTYTFVTNEPLIGVDGGISSKMVVASTDKVAAVTGTISVAITHFEIVDATLGTSAITMSAGQTQELKVRGIDANKNIDKDYGGAAGENKTLNFSGLSGIGGNNPKIENTDFGNNITIEFFNGISSTNAVTLTAYKRETSDISVLEVGAVPARAVYPCNATVNAAAGIAVAYTSGNNQTVIIRNQIANPLVVTVADVYTNPVTGHNVNFEVYSVPVGATGSSVTPAFMNTNISGQASTYLGAGDKGGAYVVRASGIKANSDPLNGSPVSFTTNATEPTALIQVSGYAPPQTGTVNAALANPFVVKLQDINSNAVPNETVTFAIISTPLNATGQSLSTYSIATNVSGQASTTLTLGNLAGSYAVRATYAGVIPSLTADFTCSAIAANPYKVVLTGPATVNAGTPSGAYTVAIRDQNDNLTNVVGNTVFNLTTTGSGSFYSDSGCTQQITSVTVIPGSNSVAFYYKQTLVGNADLTATWVSGDNLNASFRTSTVAVGIVPADLHHFIVTGTGPTLTTGDSMPATVRAYDINGNLRTNYTGSMVMRFSGASVSPSGQVPTATNATSQDVAFGTDTLLSFTAGEAQSTIKVYKAETANVKASSGAITTADPDALSIIVKHNEPNHLKLQGNLPTPQIAGGNFSFGTTLSGVDLYDNVCDGANGGTAYNGTKVLSWSLSGESNGPTSGTDAFVTSVSFTAGVSTTNLASTLYRAQNTTLTANDGNLLGTNAASNAITVNAADINMMIFAQEPSDFAVPSQALAQQPIVALTDIYGNVCSNKSATITLDASTTSGTFTPVVNGTLTADSLILNTNFGAAGFTNVKYSYPETIYLRAVATSVTGGVTVANAYSRAIIFSVQNELVTASVAGAANTVSSIANTEAAQVTVLRFSITDGGADGLPGKITQITVNRDIALDTSNGWPNYISDAYLTDGTTQTLGVISDNAITFGSGATAIYNISNATSKTFSVNIVLKNSLPAGADNKVMAFKITAVSDILLLAPATSGLAIATVTHASSVDVAATKLVVSASLPPAINAGTTNAITVSAKDINNNIDADYHYPTTGKNLKFSGANPTAAGLIPTCTNYAGTAKDFGVWTAVQFSEGVSTGTLNMVLYKAEIATVTATDDANLTALAQNDKLTIVVNGGVASNLFWNVQPNAIVAANAPWKDFTVAVTDAYGNTASGTKDIKVTPSAEAVLAAGAIDTVTSVSGLSVFNSFAVVSANGNYPQVITLVASADGVTPSEASTLVTLAEVYTMNITVKDTVTASAVSGFTFTAKDTNGLAVISTYAPSSNPFTIQLPYGTYTFTYVLDRYVDLSTERKADVATDGTDGAYNNVINLTEYMTTLTEATADYRVMSSFVYDETGDKLAARLWLERRGQMIVNNDINKLGTASLEAYEADNTPLNVINIAAPATDDYTDIGATYRVTVSDILKATNIFGKALKSGKTYFVKLRINYGGLSGNTNSYEAGTTFTVTFAQSMSTIVGEIQAMSTDIQNQVVGVQGTIVNESQETRNVLTQQVGTVKTDTSKILTAAETTLPEKLTAVQTDVTTAAKSAILNRENTVMLGSTLVIRYRTYENATPVITVYDPNNVMRVVSQPMIEESAGIYKYALAFSVTWPRGDYSIVCSEPNYGTMDAVVITARSTDIEDISGDVSAVLGSVTQVRDIKSTVDAFAAAFNVIEENISKATEMIAGVEAGSAEAAAAAGQMDALYNNLKEMSAKIRELGATVGYDLEKLYDVNEARSKDINYIRNKTQELRALMLLSQQMIEGAAKEEPVVQTWFEFR
jgi:hypothetical protein